MPSRHRPLRLETLEVRCVPATFGLPWTDPNRLTISFAPDGTPVAGRTSDLFTGLNQDASPNEWQRDTLAAFYAWSSQTNFDVAVVPDNGARFGSPGRLQGDPRFGDVRVGGNRLTADVLAVTSPPDPALAGTLAGDVFVNTSYRFESTPYDLFSVMMHEAGHAFGLDHSGNLASPMYPRFNNTLTALTPGDVNAIRTLYGPRRNDNFEGVSGNGTFATARPVPVPTAYTGTTPLLALADLKTPADVDVFWFDSFGTPNQADDNITIRLQSQGVSLLAPTITVFWLDNGVPQEVANVTADSADFTGATLSVTFDGNDDDDGTSRRYYVQVESAADGPFKAGRYALAVFFDAYSTVALANLDRVGRGPYQSLGADALATLLLDPTGTLVNIDGGTNDTLSTAKSLTPNVVYNGIRRYEQLGSLAPAGDTDVYRIAAPYSRATVLTAHVWALNDQLARPRLSVFDVTGKPVPAEILVNDSGVFTVQAIGLAAGAAYFIRLTGDDYPANYFLTADFGAVATNVRTFAEGLLTAKRQRDDTLYVGQAQLFHFALAVTGRSGAVQMTIRDDDGEEMLTLTAAVGDTVSAPAVLLRPGEFRVTILLVEPALSSELAFRLRGNRITDPIGPVAQDVTLTPEYRDPNNPDRFRYPPGVITTDPFLWVIGLF